MDRGADRPRTDRGGGAARAGPWRRGLRDGGDLLVGSDRGDGRGVAGRLGAIRPRRGDPARADVLDRRGVRRRARRGAARGLDPREGPRRRRDRIVAGPEGRDRGIRWFGSGGGSLPLPGWTLDLAHRRRGPRGRGSLARNRRRRPKRSPRVHGVEVDRRAGDRDGVDRSGRGVAGAARSLLAGGVRSGALRRRWSPRDSRDRRGPRGIGVRSGARVGRSLDRHRLPGVLGEDGSREGRDARRDGTRAGGRDADDRRGGPLVARTLLARGTDPLRSERRRRSVARGGTSDRAGLRRASRGRRGARPRAWRGVVDRSAGARGSDGEGRPRGDDRSERLRRRHGDGRSRRRIAPLRRGAARGDRRRRRGRVARGAG